jgi:la-related protein 1
MPGLLTPAVDMAAPSSFSYAQAAKGQGSTPSNASPNPASPAQIPSTQSDDIKSTTLTEKPLEATDVAVGPIDQLNGADRGDKESVQGVSESVTSDSVSGQRAETRKDDEVSRLERPWRRNDKGTRNSSTMTRSTEDNDTKKPRRGKKGGRNAEKAAGDQASDTAKEQDAEPEAPKIELSEAPIPSVNIWQQRKEAQLAKTHETPAETSEPAGTDNVQDATKPTAGTVTAQEMTPAANGAKPARKAGDGTRSERNGSRGSRPAAEKGGKDAKGGVPPPVEDAISWPTPENSIQDQQKKPGEKGERSEKDAQEDIGSGKRQKDKWVHMPFTASASFQTPLPQLRSSKPRTNNRGSNGTRSGAGTQPGEKAAAAGTQPNKSADEKISRPRDVSNGANGAPSASSAAKRASVDPANAREQRKSAVPAAAEKIKEAAPSHGMVSDCGLSGK